jgi:hypothetical protein
MNLSAFEPHLDYAIACDHKEGILRDRTQGPDRVLSHVGSVTRLRALESGLGGGNRKQSDDNDAPTGK